MIFLDSTVLIEYFNDNSTWQVEALLSILGKELVVLGDYVFLEVLQGFKKEKDYRNAKEILFAFPIYNIGGRDNAVNSANSFRFLRKKGITIRKTLDVMIATFCIENNFTLLHNDKDFDPFEKHLGLKVYKMTNSL